MQIMYVPSMMLRFAICLFAALAGFAAPSPLRSDSNIVALVFVSSECPISNKFAPEIERLSKKFSANGVSFTIVYPNASDTDEKIAQHRRDYHLTGAFVRDPKHDLVKAAGA